MYERFTDRARKVMQLATQEAQRLNHRDTDMPHIACALCKLNEGIAADAMRSLLVEPADLLEPLRSLMTAGSEPTTVTGMRTMAAKCVIENAFDEARKLQCTYLGTEHILLSILRLSGTHVVKLFESKGIAYSVALEAVKRALKPAPDDAKVHTAILQKRETLKMARDRILMRTLQIIEDPNLSAADAVYCWNLLVAVEALPVTQFNFEQPKAE